MIRWLRLVLPSPSLGVLFVVLYGIAYCAIPITEWFMGLQLPAELRWYFTRPFLFVCTILYAIWRVHGFHPQCRADYQKWLESTPWSSRKSLPLGPIHLVLQDVVIIGLVVLVTWLIGDEWAQFVPQLFLIV